MSSKPQPTDTEEILERLNLKNFMRRASGVSGQGYVLGDIHVGRLSAEIKRLLLLRLKMMKLRAACEEIVERENEDLRDMHDPNCFGAGWSSGAINAAREVISCIDEEVSDGSS